MREDQYENLVAAALARDDSETHFQIEEAGVEWREYLYVIRWRGWNGVCLDIWSEELSYWFVDNPAPVANAPDTVPYDSHWGEASFPSSALVTMSTLQRIVRHYVTTGERAEVVPWRRLTFDGRTKTWVAGLAGLP